MRNPLLLVAWLTMALGVQAAEYSYRLTWLAPHLHTYVVDLEVAPQGAQTTFSMPSWRPGRYRDQSFAAGVSEFAAFDEKGKPLAWEKPDPGHWQVSTAGASVVHIRYHIRADNLDAGSSYMGYRQIYFNPVSVFMHTGQDYEADVSLTLPELSADWQVASAMDFDRERKTFSAPSYHEFVDCPVVIAPVIHQLRFEDAGTRFWLHFQGDYKGNARTDAAILKAVKQICQEQRSIFGAYPFEEFHFIYRLQTSRFRHAVEHSNSVSFAIPAAVTETPQKIVNGLANFTAHEFFHAWNVKRIRPARLWPYDYSRPQHSGLHWFTEGVTDYYSFLSLVRCGIWDEQKFLKRLGDNLSRCENDFAAWKRSAVEVSLDSWQDRSPYRPNEWNVSYYTLGMRLGLLIDLQLRQKSRGKLGLDDLFRYLMETYYEQGMGVPENGIQTGLEAISGNSWADFFTRYVNGVEPFDYQRLFKSFGLKVEHKPQRTGGLVEIGILQSEGMEQGLLLNQLHPGGDARKAGLSPGEIILQVDGKRAVTLDLDAYFADVKNGRTVQIQALTFGGLRNLDLIKTGAFSPQNIILSTIEPQNKLKADWLRSQVK